MTSRTTSNARRSFKGLLLTAAVLALSACGMTEVTRKSAVQELAQHPNMGAISGTFVMYQDNPFWGKLRHRIEVSWRRYGNWLSDKPEDSARYKMYVEDDGVGTILVPPGVYYVDRIRDFYLLGRDFVEVQVPNHPAISIPRLGYVKVDPGQIVHLGRLEFVMAGGPKLEENDTVQWRAYLDAQAPGLARRVTFQSPKEWLNRLETPAASAAELEDYLLKTYGRVGSPEKG
ncbi:MAG: hypothetical protein WCZ23_16120 [Rhodospirillaceae bacterium]